MSVPGPYATVMFQQSEDKPRTSRGFTLIELMVAITVIGILAGALLIVINPVEQLKKGRDAQRKHDLSQVQKALEVYFNDKGRYPANGEIVWGSTWPGYMEVTPKDPVQGQSYGYDVLDNGASYRLFAKLERCWDAQIMPGVTNCETAPYNYSVVSSNLQVGGEGGIAPLPTASPTPTPTITPTMTPATATPTPTPTSTPAPFPVKRAFVSKTWVDGSINGNNDVTGADNFCQSQAIQNGLGGSWVAWLSNGSSGSAVSRLNPSGAQYRYMLVDMTTLVANSWTDLTDGTLIHAIDKNQFGELNSGIIVWTNTKIDGQKIDSGSTGTCANWGNNSSSRRGNVGHTLFADSKWTQFTDGSQFQCDIYRALYCFEK